MNRGGARPGSGRKLGHVWSSTLEKSAAREAVRQFVTQNLGVLLQSQLHNAAGLNHLMLRDPKTGQFTRVTGDAAQVDKACKQKNAVWIYTKDPNIQAFTDLLNRAIDKPAEHIQVAGHDGGPIVIQWQTPDHDSSVVDITPEEQPSVIEQPKLLKSKANSKVKHKKK